MVELLPHARVGHIGGATSTRRSRRGITPLPANVQGSTALIVDPMLATGGSALAAIEILRQAGVKDIRLLCIVAAPEGIAAVERVHAQLPIYTAAVDPELNAHKFIMPGLGDFGDRLYGTT